MKLRGATFFSILVFSLQSSLVQSSIAQSGVAQRSAVASPVAPRSCGLSGSGMISMHSPRETALSLCDGHAIGGSIAASRSAQPLALASADFDEDGTADLVSGFAEGNTGSVTVHRGNVGALWPYGAALRNGPPEAFFPNARRFSIPEAPDFVAAGDFNADGHLDIVTAHRGSESLYLLRGDGRGNFRPALRFQLAGAVTEMIAGEINHRDGLTDLIIAVSAAAGSRVLVYESPAGALNGTPEIFKFSQPVTGLALSRLDGTAMNDLAVATGNQLAVIHARDRKLALGAEQSADVARASITVQEMSFKIKALVAGDFSGTGPSVAALDENGTVHIMEHAMTHSSIGAQALENSDFAPTFQIAGHAKDSDVQAIGGVHTPGMAAKIAAARNVMKSAGQIAEWTERSTVSLPSRFSQTIPHLVAGRVSGSAEEDILVADSGNRQVHVLSSIAERKGPRALTEFRGAIDQVTPRSMSLLASLSATSAPVVVLPMRLSKHGLSGLVTLHEGQSAPVVMPHDTPPDNVFTVTNTSDAIIKVETQVTGPTGSLRKAIYDANNATGTSEIVFNIPTSDPGYKPATGTFLIQPLSESVPGAFNNFALPPIDATITIDGYTQPGASPNTLANGDNAKILIQIDGGKATTPGGSGLVPFDDNGSVFRGLDFTGWTNPAISNNTASGAEGIEANGVGDFIEGNFFGTDPTGKFAAPNRIGIFADNGPLFGSAPGNIIGGTTPQARNILSGNSNSGILFLSTAYEAQLQGNYVGLDVTGAAIVSNPQEADRSNTFDGVGLNGPTVTIGGTLPGTANVIAGNGTNVDINDLTEGGAASDSSIQGNLIGTDATGTHAIANQGYGVSILHNPTNMTIGGTTPAGRNIISGNLAGVYIFDNSFYNIVEGNFIGTDVTGTKAVGNVQQGFVSGATSSTEKPAGYTTIGGLIAGAGNVISGNTTDGILISGTSQSQSYPNPEVGNTIEGNFIGTDLMGTKSIPNQGNGINLGSNATNNIIGGTAPGAGNLIANNKGHGVLIDPAPTSGGIGVGNNTIANSIQSNGGSGVRILSGTGNRISQNSIFGNKNLGIDLDVSGPDAISHCNATNDGANSLQNAPSLTGGSGTAYITATATDPNGNTSEFSNAVKSSPNGNVISLLGNFDSVANTNYTIEFFSNTVADASGFGQGQTYLTSTSVKTGADCTIAINDPVDTTKADVSVTLSSDTTVFDIGPDFGQYSFTSTVANNGPATAHNVVFTDTLPAGLEISSAYCNVGPCQTPAVSTLGNCTVSGKKITCNMGTMAPGATAQVTLPIQATAAGALSDSAAVTATEADPALANNTATLEQNVYYPFPFIDHVDPTSAVTITSGSLPLTVYGSGFLPTSAVTFNGTAVQTKGYLDNQVCGGPFQPGFCSAIQVSVPASLLGTAGTATVTVTNPDPGPGGGGSNFPSSASFTLVSACTYDPEFFGFNPVGAEGDTLIPEEVEVSTNAPTCPWTATSNASWLVILDNAKGTGSGTFDVAVAPNTGAARSGTLTVAGKTVEIDQEAGDSTICTYGLNPPSAHIPAAGNSGAFAVTTNSSCSYFVEPYPQDSSYVTGVQFITIPQSSGLLVGNGNPAYTVAANHGAPRTGAIMVGGDVFTLTQDAPSCYYTLDSNAATIPTTGGSGTIGVTASSSSCAWTAKSSDASVVTVSSGASGTGNGTVKYTVKANTEGPQTPTITIGDANGYSIYSITQASAFTCTFTISPNPKSVGSNGTTDFFLITASYNFCKWKANSSDPTALAITENSSGTGSGAVYYTVGQNTTGAPRTLTITAGCETFTVNQSGAAASNPAPAITSLTPTGTTAGSAQFTLTVNGTGFIATSSVNFNGHAVNTTYMNATQLTAVIPAADVASAATVPVTVTNPSPGGGTSAPANFVISAGTSVPVASLSPSSLTFSAVAASTSAAQTVTLKNTGNAALTISGISIAGTNPTDFAQTNTCGSSLAASASCAISVTFTPASAASFTATLSVADNATGSPQTVALSGTGTTATAPAVSLTPASLTFTATTGTTSAAQTATLKNTGSAALNITSITLGGTGAANFTQTNTCGSSLAVNASCSISVTFTPASAASFTATISIADNAAGSPQTVTLNGTGTAPPTPTYTVTSTTTAQTVQPGGTAVYTITVTAQNGTFPNAVTLAASGLPAGATATFNPASITPGSSSGSSQLSIQTATATSISSVGGRGSGWPVAATLLPLFGLMLATRKARKRWMTVCVLLLASLGAVTALSGCGGGFALPGSGAKNYTITVTGTSGETQQSTTVQLKVQ